MIVPEMERLLDERVRPYLKEHLGDVELLSLEKGVLRLKFLGQCSRCPSALSTVEELVGRELTAAFPQIREVVLVQDAPEDQLELARRLLRGERP